ncbi:hypothetical protein [Pseudomonas phage GP100]|nr:hypothetical protein [Pseudomonas phage GP100]
MKALFLESYAAGQITAYARAKDLDAEELLQLAYDYGRVYPNQLYSGSVEEYSELWVNLCLGNDSHKDVTVNTLIRWAPTPEGAIFWASVNHYKPGQ